MWHSRVLHAADVEAAERFGTAALSLSLCRLKTLSSYKLEVWVRERFAAATTAAAADADGARRLAVAASNWSNWSAPALLATERLTTAASGVAFVDAGRCGARSPGDDRPPRPRRLRLARGVGGG